MSMSGSETMSIIIVMLLNKSSKKNIIMLYKLQ